MGWGFVVSCDVGGGVGCGIVSYPWLMHTVVLLVFPFHLVASPSQGARNILLAWKDPTRRGGSCLMCFYSPVRKCNPIVYSISHF